jgi:hypothetical protein
MKIFSPFAMALLLKLGPEGVNKLVAEMKAKKPRCTPKQAELKRPTR